MEIKTIGEINQYAGTSVNPLNSPETTYELYSVPSYDMGYPEIVDGKEIGSTKITVEEGDVLICKINPRINRVWVVKHNTEYPLLASSEWIVVRNKEIDSEYLKWYFASEQFRLKLNSQVAGIGGSLTRAQPKQVSKYTVPIPCHEIQSKIASELDKVTELIEHRQKQLEKLDELVKARFVELFELHSWPKCKASTFMDNMRNGVSPSNAGTHKARVLTLSAITQGAFDRSAWKEGDFDCIPSEDKRVSACDFYMCRGNGNRNLVGSGVYSKENLYDLVFPDTVIAARVDTNMVRLPFLCEAWKGPSIRNQIEAGARTTNGTFKINQKVIANIDISLPPIELQDSFATFVEQTDKSKVEIQKSLEQLETLKKALMQKYFG